MTIENRAQDLAFEIPADLGLETAGACLSDLREKIAACPPDAMITIDLGEGAPTQLALELLHSAGISADAGAALGFSEAARQILDMARVEANAPNLGET